MGFHGIWWWFDGISWDFMVVFHGIVHRFFHGMYPPENSCNYGKSPFLMGKSTISMAIFNSFLYVYQRVFYVDLDGQLSGRWVRGIDTEISWDIPIYACPMVLECANLHRSPIFMTDFWRFAYSSSMVRIWENRIWLIKSENLGKWPMETEDLHRRNGGFSQGYRGVNYGNHMFFHHLAIWWVWIGIYWDYYLEEMGFLLMGC